MSAFPSQTNLKKQILNQLKAFESYYNKRKNLIGIKCEKKITKSLTNIKKALEVEL